LKRSFTSGICMMRCSSVSSVLITAGGVFNGLTQTVLQFLPDDARHDVIATARREPDDEVDWLAWIFVGLLCSTRSSRR